MSRSAIYFLAPTRNGGTKVIKVLEHGPYHQKRPASWRGPYPSEYDAKRAAIAQPIKPARRARPHDLITRAITSAEQAHDALASNTPADIPFAAGPIPQGEKK